MHSSAHKPSDRKTQLLSEILASPAKEARFSTGRKPEAPALLQKAQAFSVVSGLSKSVVGG